ncbi:MAG: hypothetical protein KUG69_13150 [Marinosulfonomonas sp.]|nr:hypothetical protein [Marinosulfonomonas sp.]
MNTGNTWAEGSMSKDEMAELDEWVVTRDDCMEQVDILRGELKNSDGEKNRSFLETDMAPAQ